MLARCSPLPFAGSRKSRAAWHLERQPACAGGRATRCPWSDPSEEQVPPAPLPGLPHERHPLPFPAPDGFPRSPSSPSPLACFLACDDTRQSSPSRGPTLEPQEQPVLLAASREGVPGPPRRATPPVLGATGPTGVDGRLSGLGSCCAGVASTPSPHLTRHLTPAHCCVKALLGVSPAYTGIPPSSVVWLLTPSFLATWLPRGCVRLRDLLRRTGRCSPVVPWSGCWILDTRRWVLDARHSGVSSVECRGSSGKEGGGASRCSCRWSGRGGRPDAGASGRGEMPRLRSA